MADREQILALQRRSFDLACGVINAFPKQTHLDDASRIVWRQLIRASSSSTFNLEEADAASSDADFLSKMRIALREAKETRVAAYGSVARFEDEARQMAAIFATIVVNKKASMNRRTRT